MPLYDSPKIDQFKKGLPKKLPDMAGRRKRQHIALASVVVLFLLLIGLQFIRSDQASVLAGVGTVKGMVVDELNLLPVSAEVFISGSDQMLQTDANGYFEISNVPAGPRTLIVAYRNTGREYQVNVTRGSTIDMGILDAPTLARPYLDENYVEE
jgi:hypothetical protein